jgi:uncharacterized protein YwgA
MSQPYMYLLTGQDVAELCTLAVSRHRTQDTRTNRPFVHVPLEDMLNVSQKHVRLRQYTSIKLCIMLVTVHLQFRMYGPYSSECTVLTVQNVRSLQFRMYGPYSSECTVLTT